MSERPITGGQVAPGFERVADAFVDNLVHRGEVGAACAAYVDGRLVVDLWGGTLGPDDPRPYGPDTLQMVASVTKGALAICLLRQVESGLLDLDAPVAAYWPEFGAHGKDRVTVREALAHRAGVPVIDGGLTLDDVAAWDPAAEALAAQAPVWEPGARHGYHALTFAWLIGELLRRVSGMLPGELIAAELAGPLGLDLYVGLSEAEHARVAPLRPYAPPEGSPPDALTLAMLDPGSLAHRAFFVSSGLFSWMNDPRLWSAQVPSANGMGTARAIAAMYAACLSELDGIRLLGDATLADILRPGSEGRDAVAGYETRYALGFQLPFPYRPMSGEGAFGHYGLGGSAAFADTRRGFSFGYTVNAMGPGTPADARSVALVDALVECLG